MFILCVYINPFFSVAELWSEYVLVKYIQLWIGAFQVKYLRDG